MASWPENPRLIGTEIPRLDGLAKASGRAKYPSDMRPEGTLFGVMLYSPHAHAKVKSIDTSAAEKMPGVKAVVVDRQGGDDPPLPGRRHRRRRRRDRGAGPRRRPRHQGRVRGPAPRRHRGPGDGRRAPRGRQGRQRPQGPRARPRASPTRRWPRPTSTIEGDLLAAGHHPRLPRAPRPDRQVGRRRQDRRLGEHPGRRRSSPASWPTRSASRPPTSRCSPR